MLSRQLDPGSHLSPQMSETPSSSSERCWRLQIPLHDDGLGTVGRQGALLVDAELEALVVRLAQENHS